MATKDIEDIQERLRDLTAVVSKVADLNVDARDELRRLAERIALLEGPVKRLVDHLEAKDRAFALIEAERQAGKNGLWTLLSNPTITTAIAAIVGAILSYLGLTLGGANASP